MVNFLNSSWLNFVNPIDTYDYFFSSHTEEVFDDSMFLPCTDGSADLYLLPDATANGEPKRTVSEEKSHFFTCNNKTIDKETFNAMLLRRVGKIYNQESKPSPRMFTFVQDQTLRTDQVKCVHDFKGRIRFYAINKTKTAVLTTLVLGVLVSACISFAKG